MILFTPCCDVVVHRADARGRNGHHREDGGGGSVVRRRGRGERVPGESGEGEDAVGIRLLPDVRREEISPGVRYNADVIMTSIKCDYNN